jgi:hypothetical protein
MYPELLALRTLMDMLLLVYTFKIRLENLLQASVSLQVNHIHHLSYTSSVVTCHACVLVLAEHWSRVLGTQLTIACTLYLVCVSLISLAAHSYFLVPSSLPKIGMHQGSC